MIEWTTRENIGILRLAHGKASALDIELLEALENAFHDAEKYDAVVITGTGKIFSAGVDLFRLTNEGASYVDRFLPALDRAFLSILRYSKPVVAAVNGHAIAGGCLIALACDRTLMVESGAKMGVPELRVGVPFPTLAARILEASASPSVARTLALTGMTVEGAEARQKGLVDLTCTSEELMERAIDAARDLLQIPLETFALTKKIRNERVIRKAAEDDVTAKAAIYEIWRSPATHQTIRNYLAVTVGRK